MDFAPPEVARKPVRCLPYYETSAAAAAAASDPIVSLSDIDLEREFGEDTLCCGEAFEAVPTAPPGSSSNRGQLVSEFGETASEMILGLEVRLSKSLFEQTKLKNDLLFHASELKRLQNFIESTEAQKLEDIQAWESKVHREQRRNTTLRNLLQKQYRKAEFVKRRFVLLACNTGFPNLLQPKIKGSDTFGKSPPSLIASSQKRKPTIVRCAKS